MGYNPFINKVYWGYNPLILTFDPNFQRDIQAGSGLLGHVDILSKSRRLSASWTQQKVSAEVIVFFFFRFQYIYTLS